jgi:FMN phosphatase YigB (HAD superfamily)
MPLDVFFNVDGTLYEESASTSSKRARGSERLSEVVRRRSDAYVRPTRRENHLDELRAMQEFVYGSPGNLSSEIAAAAATLVPAPGVRRFLADAASAGHRVRVLTAAPAWYVSHLLEVLGLAEFFVEILDLYSTAGLTKRQKECFYLVERCARTSARDAMLVDDSATNAATARAAGWTTIEAVSGWAERHSLARRVPRVLGLHGESGAGKNTAAAGLEGRVARPAFAAALKEGAASLFGLTHDQLYGAGRNVVDPRFGKTPRQLLQALGDFVRGEIRATNFVDLLVEKCEAESGDVDTVAVTDVRFPNEARAVRERMGGKIVRIVRPGEKALAGTAAASHASENPLPDDLVDFVIVNDGTIEDLREKLCVYARSMAV